MMLMGRRYTGRGVFRSRWDLAFSKGKGQTMGIVVTADSRPKPLMEAARALLSTKTSTLLEELDHYRKRTEQLTRVYRLHRQVGEKLDLASMIEAFSTWLMPHLDHELVAFHSHDGKRKHISCSCHGPHRQKLIQAAEELLNRGLEEVRSKEGDGNRHGVIKQMDLYFSLLPMEEAKTGKLLLIHRDGAPQQRDLSMFVHELVNELQGPLERALSYEELYDQARRDTLTGLVNRRVFEERLHQELVNAERYGHPLALACLDLDHFKAVNDIMGHAEGDSALRRVSTQLIDMVRDSDLLARVGGDEFALILPNTCLDHGLVLMERLCDAVKDLNIKAPGAKRLGVSIGLAVWEPKMKREDWMQRADEALYRAKAAGRSQVSL